MRMATRSGRVQDRSLLELMGLGCSAGLRVSSAADSEQSDNSWVDTQCSTPMEQECSQVLGSIRLSPRKQRSAAPKWQQQRPTLLQAGR